MNWKFWKKEMQMLVSDSTSESFGEVVPTRLELRVKHFHDNYWVIEQRGAFGWSQLTRANCWGSKSIGTRDHPCIYPKSEAIQEAKRLSDPAAMAEHIARNDALWAKAQARWYQEELGRDVVIYIDGPHP